VTKADFGQKRLCSACSTRFYDLGKNPAKCPKCGTMNDAAAPVKVRRNRKPAALAVDNDDPLVKAKAAVKPPPKPKKPVKEIEDVDLEEFEDIETLDAEEDIEEIEEMEDIETLEVLEEAGQSEPVDGDAAIEEESVGDATLIDGVEEVEEGEPTEEDEKKTKTRTKIAAKAKKKGKK